MQNNMHQTIFCSLKDLLLGGEKSLKDRTGILFAKRTSATSLIWFILNTINYNSTLVFR